MQDAIVLVVSELGLGVNTAAAGQRFRGAIGAGQRHRNRRAWFKLL